MTFHDQIHQGAEESAYKNTKELMLWLGTIAPLSGIDCLEARKALEDMAKKLGWTLVEDEYIGAILK